MIARRTLLQLGLGAGVLGTVASPALALGGARPRSAAAVPHFTRPLTVPPVLRPVRRTRDTDHYLVVVRRALAELVPGVRTEVLSYGGGLPGPTISATRGRRAAVHHVNTLADPVSAHLHGGANPVEHDGGMMDTVPRGGRRTYVYENDQSAASLWVHDHAHHVESEHVYRGLSHLYLLRDPAEDALGLPSGRYDVPLVLRDARLDERGRLVYELDDAEQRSTVLVNGRAWPYLDVAARKYRLRLVNASNLRTFVLALSDGAPLQVIASDGGLLERPFPTPVVVVSPGERVEVVADFSGYAPGTQLVLANMTGPGPMDQVGEVLRFHVGAPAPDDSRVPEVLRALPPLPEPTVRREFVLSMDEPGTGHAGHGGHGAEGRSGTINGRTFDPARIDTRVRWGTTEHWTVTNAGATVPHNFHLHLAQFRLLTRDGRPVDPTEAGEKDTVLLFPGQTVTLQATFDTHRGVYPYHCHLVDHAAMGMTGQLEVV
ncbi:multicopper oxidase family protein [Vallicoccus soli]|uniref:Multicopper oxidase CueO n=1 Tax=Vallicoccus soli TaxID=2339232 RepID=A0A3A3Z060_9ACTN|nr:multicopper oxidase domain-containing protein [Vallicoccus soli]RJK97639.1 multicopper oxidase family protein [Vallicoccus soli]